MTAFVERLRSQGCWLGASWLPRLNDRGYLLGAVPVNGRVLLSAIGGKVEAGEGFLEAAWREYVEETGTPPPTLIPWPSPTLLGTEDLPADDTEGGAILIRTVPRAKDPVPAALWIMVFTGVATHPPRPVEKLPAFVVVPPPALVTVLDRRALPADVEVIGAPVISLRAPVTLAETLTAVAAEPQILDRLWDESASAGRQSG